MPRKIDPSTIKKGSGMANQNSVDANAFVDEVVEGQTHGLNAHVNDPKGAHPASAISTTTSGGQYDSNDVQGNLDELSALVPTRPPTIGNFSTLISFTGIPDWGSMKLLDAGLIARGAVTSPDPNTPNDDSNHYPVFWWPVDEATYFGGTNPPGQPFDPSSNDPATDRTFNVVDGVYTGGGPGLTHAGGFTRVFGPGPGPIIETVRITANQNPDAVPVVLSAAVYPADRGVIALFRWPAAGDVTDFLAQPLGDRVVAAILCGQGVGDDCDGDPGKLFSEGDPDIFAFPGRATGQLDLAEVHAGVNNQTGNPLPDGPLPSAGKVRLGTDPAAGEPPIVGGIPILGATSIAVGGGNDNNFFRYRLPYLEDYTAATGIEFTPPVERPRFFEKPAVALSPLVDLIQAGDYADFDKNYWTFQVSRLRHRFEFLNVAPPASFQDDGQYILVHFKRESDFEAFARDGVMPDDLSFGYELWSAGLVNYTNPESTDNLTDNTGASPVTSSAYHVLRAAIFEDIPPAPISLGSSYTFIREVDEVHTVSGIKYFLPNGSGVGTNWQIDTLTLGIGNFWTNTYLLGRFAGALDITPGLGHRPPALLYCGNATADANVLLTAAPGFSGSAEYQRIEMDYTDLDSVSGPFSLAVGPTSADSADMVLGGGDTPLAFAGDDAQCHFWGDARLRAFTRTPLGHDSPATTATEYLFANPGGATLLFHTTSHSPTLDSGGRYGNFTLGGPGNPPRVTLEDARKDVEELFLDEVYRVLGGALPTLDPTFNGVVGNITGPGLPFPAATIELPVRFASSVPATYGFASFLQTDSHLLDLTVLGAEAQVAGLPDRNPPASDGVANPRPFSGLLLYPQTDFTVGHRPSNAAGDITNTQFNYSGIAIPDVRHIRVFDAAWSNDATPEPGVLGQNILYFRIDGLELADFAYAAPGPGSANVAIEIKIPGLTTWMDLGRLNGGGPGKQDPLLDGAGCQIVSPTETFNGRDPVTGTVFAQVKIDVGPVANVFPNVGPVAPVGVAPVLVRVRLKLASATVLDFGASGGSPNDDSDIPRGMCGITLLRLSDQSRPLPLYGPPAPPFPLP